MGYYGEFPPYVPVAERKNKAKKAIEKLKKKNPSISPVIIEGRIIAKSWWGKAWAKNLENYADYSNRIGRGRSYVKHGSVLDLKIAKGNIKALVLGSSREPYNVNIKINALNKKVWENIIEECLGKIESIEELTEGKFPKSLETLFTSKGKGLFPSPNEIDLKCNCPDVAIMCKHIAAALYGVAVYLDNNPEMFFILRGVNINDLISQAVSKKAKSMLEKSEIKGRRVIENEEIFDMFGIDTEDN
ncbi:SWIM zinc finger family protein [Clostridium sp. Marseille-Q2269]|uniref:SWIM zinc finger family protein n=1 Tax=Clostridium sp. Marseille-Q2269 TaxID=2942205 RepID=UPI002072ED80|nr:SWIM zinc finger family protein [Clostridium sp. Marseille-Q2269]